VIVAIIPNRWATGRASRDGDSGRIPVAWATVTAFHRRFSCESITPLGRPVVPPVYMIRATSWPSRSAIENSGLASAIRAA
jgi:hypothetical protein